MRGTNPSQSSVKKRVTITGVIKDETETPIVGANILEKGTTNGTISDIDGKFTLEITSGQSILDISYIGYISQNVPVKGQPGDPLSRKPEIEKYMGQVYSATEFQLIADSLHMSVSELCNYPVIFPVKKPERMSSGFGMHIHPVYRVWKFHTGIDISGIKGTPMYATGNGTVIRKGYCSGYGNFIEIMHAGGFRSFYAHLSKTIVSVGDSVEIARQIACIGSTGLVTGSHLHYEIRKGNRYLNPTGWCDMLFVMKIQVVKCQSNK